MSSPFPAAAEEYAWPCVRASLYVSWYLVTRGKKEAEECRDKFRDRSNGDAVSMLLAFAFRLSIQTPLSQTFCLVAPPFPIFFVSYLCLPSFSPSFLLPTSSFLSSFYFLFNIVLDCVHSPSQFAGSRVNYRMKFNRRSSFPGSSPFYDFLVRLCTLAAVSIRTPSCYIYCKTLADLILFSILYHKTHMM